MRILVCMCVFSAGLAAQVPAKTSPPPAAKQTQKAPTAITVPKDAIEIEPGFYRWTDKDGKVWKYRRTPFGVKRWPAEPVDAERIAPDKRTPAEGGPAAVEEGDSIRFEQNTPFGKKTWVRKKTELNESEQKIWDLQKKNSAANTTEKE